VPRKRIEQAIELVRRLDLPVVLVISHAAGDEGTAYARYLQDYAHFLDVDLRFASDRIAHRRSKTPAGEKIYSLADAYQRADLITYPSAIEGFGNAFLETLYYRRPIVLNRYSIFKTDILPKGFEVVSFEDYVDTATVEDVRELLQDTERVAEMVEHNYDLAKRYYAFDTLRRRLRPLLDQALLT
jgi:glycosyltransferase involved in cell wall biosynthesis